jgi:hypothetical protein
MLDLGSMSDEEVKQLMRTFKESLADLKPIWVSDARIEFISTDNWIIDARL